MAAETNENFLLQSRSADVRVQIVPSHAKKLTHLAKRPPVDLAFSDLTYTVRQGKGEFFAFLCWTIIIYKRLMSPFRFYYGQLTSHYGNVDK